MKDLDIKLTALYEKKLLKEKVIIHAANIEQKIKEREKELEQILEKIKRSELYFEQIELSNIKNIFSKILGNAKKQFERERQYYLINILKSREIEERISSKKFERKVLQEQLDSLSSVDQNYEKALAEKKYQLKIKNRSIAGEVILLESEIRKQLGKRKEIKEAIAAGEKVIFELKGLSDSLDVIENWGKFQLLHIGYQEKKYLKSIITEVRNVNVCLDNFMDELNDVSQHYKIDYHQFIQRISRFLEHFYDGLISDWIINKKIQVSGNLVLETEEKINRMIKMLYLDIEDTEEKEQKWNKALEAILIAHKLK